ncbi:MAG TPA: hypothetical protein VGL61_07635 [Kofleriaceae bacterium]|jgi:pyruvate/2-oxoglutarate dehydrogenase complex dihydrolipoamide acyltransferase (E2) component
MPTRPDLRDISTNVREAFADLDKDALLDILTFVVKEYVVEGPPPMLVHQAETLADLRTASFAQLITAMQTRFDFPELAMFVVDGDQVSVRVNGVVQPLIGQRQPLQAPPQVQMVDTRPQPGVRVVETNLAQRPAAPPQPTAASAPPPARGLSVRGRPSSGEAPEAPPAPQPAPQQPAAPQPAAAAPASGDKPDKPEGGDDASARFSLLELD